MIEKDGGRDWKKARVCVCVCVWKRERGGVVGKNAISVLDIRIWMNK